MCRFNIVYVKNDNHGILEQSGYDVFDEEYNGYTGYVKGCCNCGSFVGSMSETEDSYESYDEMVSCETKKELEMLYEVRELMHKPDYRKIREQYVEKRDILLDKMFAMTEEVNEYELEQMEKLDEKYDCEPPEDIVNELYEEVEKRLDVIYSSDEYKKQDKMLDDLRNKNAVLEKSTMYYLTKEEQDKEMYDGVSATELLAGDDETLDGWLSELIGETDEEDCLECEFEEPSMVIDDVIEKMENETGREANAEFEEYKNLFDNLLNTNEDILFATIWSEVKKYNFVNEISLSEMKMEDLAKMDYFDIIKVDMGH